MANRVYFGRLPRDAETRDLEKIASEFGRIKDVRLLTGFAFVEFEDSRDARDAVRELDGSRFMGERITVEIAKGGDRRDRGDRGDRGFNGRSPERGPRRHERRRGLYRLTILGLPPRTSWQDLKDLMRKAGEVVFTDVDRNGDGTVEFANDNDMSEAIRLFDDYDYNGSRISVKKDVEAIPPRDRSPRDDRRRSPPRRFERSPPRRYSPRRRSVSPPRNLRDASPPRGRQDSPVAGRRSPKKSPERNGAEW